MIDIHTVTRGGMTMNNDYVIRKPLQLSVNVFLIKIAISTYDRHNTYRSNVLNVNYDS